MPRRRHEASPDAKVRVGIWIRVSTEDQAKGESPEHHEKRARMYAESRDWEVVEVYNLAGVSGKSVAQHRETERMLADIKSGHISGLIFSKIARLARNTKELLDFADLFESAGADLISLQESIDTSTPAGRLFYTIIAAMAQWEREEIADRVAASVPVRAKLGKSLGGAAPFGYRWERNRLTVDEKEAPIRRLVFELFLQQKRKRTVARLLTEAGHRTRGGGKFSVIQIQRILTDPIAKGTRRTNVQRSPARGGGIKPASDWVYVDVPAIISADVWDQANQILAQQRQGATKPAKKTAHLFSGLVYCECGAKMYVPSRAKYYDCAQCHNKVGEEDLEIIFNEQLKGFLFSSDQIARQFERADQAIEEKKQLLTTLEAERTSVAREMEKVYQLYVGDHISGHLFKERNAPLEERRRQLDDEIPRLAGELDYLRLQLLSGDEVLSEARDLHGRWPSLLFEERREIVESITDRILIADNEITIRLAYLPVESRASSKDGPNGSPTVSGWSRGGRGCPR